MGSQALMPSGMGLLHLFSAVPKPKYLKHPSGAQAADGATRASGPAGPHGPLFKSSLTPWQLASNAAITKIRRLARGSNAPVKDARMLLLRTLVRLHALTLKGVAGGAAE